MTYSNQPNFKALSDRYGFDILAFDVLASDLSLLKDLNPFISEVGIDGGSIVDMILGYPVNDYDVRYSVYNESIKEYSRECLCENVKGTLDNPNFKLLNRKNADVGNINEGGLNLSLLYKYQNGLCVNSCFTNMVLFTSENKLIGSEKSFKALMDREYVPNFYGYFQYSYTVFPRKNFHELLLEMLVRGVAYISKRNLKCHQDFKIIIDQYPKIKSEVKNYEKIIRLKFQNVEDFESFLQRFAK